MNRFLAFAIFIGVVATVVALCLFGLWLYRRPEIRRRQVKEAQQQALDYKRMVVDYEDTLRAIRERVNEYSLLDRPLAMLIELELEKHNERLDNPLAYVPRPKKKEL